MQLTIRLLGAEVLHVSTDAPTEDDQATDVTTYPVGFVARMDVPEDLEIPSREA